MLYILVEVFYWNLHNYYLLKNNYKSPDFSFSWMWCLSFLTKSVAIVFFHLLGFTVKGWSEGLLAFYNVLKDVRWKTCLKKMRKAEKNLWLPLDSLEPASIRFMFKNLQESVRQLGCFLPSFWRVTYYL